MKDLQPEEIYGEIASTSSWSWVDVNLDELPETTREYVQYWLVDLNIPFQIQKPVLENVHIFRLAVPPVCFMAHNTAGHQWLDAQFIQINDVSAVAHVCHAAFGGDIDDLGREILEDRKAAMAPYN